MFLGFSWKTELSNTPPWSLMGRCLWTRPTDSPLHQRSRSTLAIHEDHRCGKIQNSSTTKSEMIKGSQKIRDDRQ
jgi:hypothetical protein